MTSALSAIPSSQGADLREGEVASTGREGILVRVPGSGEPVLCRLLQTTDRSPLTLREGDLVLFWTPSDGDALPVIVGRIADGSLAAEPAEAPPEECFIEAGKRLVLRVGDGSITIRKDGRILIKGKDLVSHAMGMNRIRGGSVSIN